MTDSEMIDELTTLEAAATPLPWSHSPSTSAGFEAQVWDHEGQALLFFADERYTGAQADSDAAVIVAVRNALPRLLALARRYDASLKLLRQCDQTFRRFGWEDGENGEAQNEVHRAVRDLLRSETLEAEIARAALATPQDGGQS